MKITFVILGVALISIAIGFIYYGGLSKVNCRVEKQGGETLVCKQMTGDYAKSAKLMDEVYYSLLNDYGIETFKGFGLYYDNPKEVEKTKLRSEIGCIIEEKDLLKVADIKGNLQIKTFPEKSYIIAEFPNKGKLSIIFGIIKVYPAMDKFLKEKGYKKEGAVMEIYDVPNKKIIYRKEIVE